MPAYDYRCFCGYEEETPYPMGMAPEIRCCSYCGNVTLKRVYMPVAVSFKGKGFYRNDSRTSHVTSKLKAGAV